MAAAKTPANAMPTSAPSPKTNAQSANTTSTSAPATSSASRPIIPSAHTPTPAQQNPQTRKVLAPYLPEANPNAPKDPVQAMNERQRAAIESRLPKNRTQNISDASAPSSKKPTEKPGQNSQETTSSLAQTLAQTGSTEPSKPSPSDQSATPKTSADGSAPAAETQSSESSSQKPEKSSDEQQPSSEDTSSQSSSKRGPRRVDAKQMKRWAEEDPEWAAEIRQHVFDYDPASNEGFIKLAQKRKKTREEIETRQAEARRELETRENAIKEHLNKVETTTKVIAPIMDLWEGGSRKDQQGNPMPDFDAVDAAFAQTTKGLDIDTYMRLRARRGVADPEKARLRAELARLKAQGAPASASPATPPPTKAAPEAAAAAVSPPPVAAATSAADLEKKWGPEVPKTHKLRNIADWAEKFDAEMEKYHDDTLDEYSADPEQVADAVLKRELAALIGEPEEEEAPAARAKPRPKPRPAANGERPRKASFAPPDHAELMRNPAQLAPRQEAPRARRIGSREGFEDYGSQDNPRDPLIRDRPERYGDRTQWAIARAQARARGEQVE